ncbi:MAG: MFS transporter [Candidatus Malihini olakiniferum]
MGFLLGAELIARCVSSLFITPCVKNLAHLINAIRLLVLLSLILALGFWLRNAWLWLLLIIVGFNLFFSPLVPLNDGLVATWQRQIAMDYGKVRVLGICSFCD